MRQRTLVRQPATRYHPASDTPIWRLEARWKCRSRPTRRYSPPGRMIELTNDREIAPFAVHPSKVIGAERTEFSKACR